MAAKSSSNAGPLALALAMIAGTVAMMALIWTGTLDPNVAVGDVTVHHLASWSGAAFIAIYTALFYIVRRRGKQDPNLLVSHVYGGLLAFAAVSFHFASHVSRLAFEEPGTGFVLYPAVLLAVATGMFMRFRMLTGHSREWRRLHDGAAVAFYLAIVVHVVLHQFLE